MYSATDRVLYLYKPSVESAAVSAVVFFIAAIALSLKTERRKTVYMAPMIMGGLLELLGYIGRIIAHNNLENLGLFIGHTICVLLAPGFFACSMYMVLPRMIRTIDADHLSPIRTALLTIVFVGGDALALAVQSAGGAMMANPDTSLLGSRLIIVGLVVQIISFCVFVAVATIIHSRIKNRPTTASLEIGWVPHIRALYVASAFILVRSIFRTVEFAGGYHGAIMQTEIYLYLLDSALMLGVMCCFIFKHPGDLIGKDAPGQRVRLSDEDGVESQGSTELKMLEPRSMDDAVAGVEETLGQGHESAPTPLPAAHIGGGGHVETAAHSI